MTVITHYSSTARPAGFDALLITVGRYLVSAGERLAAANRLSSGAFAAHEERLRDQTAIRHSGLWI